MTLVPVLGAVTVLIVVVELMSRAAAAATDEDLWLKDVVMQRKDDQMKRLGRQLRRRKTGKGAHGSLDVLFIGSSASMCAIDPGVIKRVSGLSSYNASIFRAHLSYSLLWARDFALRRLRARNLVIEVFLPIANDNSELIENRDLYLAAPYFTTRRHLRPLYELGHHLALLRVVPRLISPSYVKATVKALAAKRQALSLRRPIIMPSVFGTFGESVEHDHRTTYQTGPRLREALTGMLRECAVGGASWDALVALIEEGVRRGMRVFLVEPPHTQDVERDYLPGGAAEWNEMCQRLKVLSADLPVTWLNPAAQLSAPRHFSDPVHANLLGKTEYSIALALALRSQLSSDGASHE